MMEDAVRKANAELCESAVWRLLCPPTLRRQLPTPQLRCESCGREMNEASLQKHKPFCGVQYRDRASHMLRAGDEGGSVLALLSKVVKPSLGKELSIGDLHERFAETVVPAAGEVGAGTVPFNPPAGLPPVVQERIRVRAVEAGCRTADREQKHHNQELALCAAISEQVKAAAPEVWERGMSTGDVRDEVCLIDVGAAAGELLHVFQGVFQTAVALIEFYKPPRMVDHLYEADPANFRRVWKRVEDVEAEDLGGMSRRLNIVVAKHLCGDGSCHALTQVVSGWRSFFHVDRLLLVPCCQQMSTWAGYCGRPYLSGLGLDEADFEHLRRKTGWKSLQHRDAKSRHRTLYWVATLLETLWHRGRADYLLRSGASEVSLSQFISDDVTIKNVVIAASWPRI
eukprot:Hpha_TRINITY_DN29897_c0_g1::TRINITY_DN29897_c0_g1_i1::g.2827::m.2827/K15446/TRM13, CCDC76; tRNA:m4X modification enzyme